MVADSVDKIPRPITGTWGGGVGDGVGVSVGTGVGVFVGDGVGVGVSDGVGVGDGVGVFVGVGVGVGVGATVFATFIVAVPSPRPFLAVRLTSYVVPGDRSSME